MRQVPYGAVFSMLAVQGMEKTNNKKYSGQQGRKIYPAYFFYRDYWLGY